MELSLCFGPAGGDRKRKSPRGACGDCRHRKKRCNHDQQDSLNPGADSLDRKFTRVHEEPVSSKSSPEHLAGNRTRKPARRHSVSQDMFFQFGLSEKVPEQFIGYLNPLATFLERPESGTAQDPDRPNEVGVWLEQDQTLRKYGYSMNRGLHVSCNAPMPPLFNMALESTENVLPPVSVQEVLVDIYFSRINTLLPLVDEEAFRAQFSMEILPPQLIQAICLVATKESGENLGALRLGEGTDLLGIENFKNTLYNLLVQCISRKESRRTVTQIQVLALLSLHTSGPDSTEDASLHLMQAIHHAQTLGLHLINKTNEHQDKAHILLFWSLWSLDRWNAAINGRPVLIGNSDMQPNMNEAFQCGRAPFRIWLRLAETLDQVIGFYRPTSKLSLFHESTFTGFEQIVEEAQGYLIPKSTLISLELLYHGISILSCGGQKGVTISNSMKIRESFATTQIVSIIHSNHAKTLLALPMIPYSISLSLCWSYNKLRKSKLLTTRHMARSALETCCRVLSEQKMLWWFAGVISRLGQRALDELGQDPSAAASSEIQEEHFDLRYGQQITSTGYEQTFCQPELPDAFRPGEGNRGLTLQESVENNMGHSSVGSIGDFHRMLLDLNMPLMSGDLF